jgi:dipeptidyl aminopeptidase/acylaminoacyl peptidase
VISTHRYGTDPAQFGELSLPSGPRAPGTVVIIHGGFWGARYDLSLGRPLAADLRKRGYAVWNLEYRRVGNGGGWPATFDDVGAGIDALRDLDVDTSHVVAIGHSAGGQLAVWAAGRSDPGVAVTGVVSQAGVLDLLACAEQRLGDDAAVALLGGPPSAHPQRYRAADPLAAVPIAAPVLCLHSPADDRVPLAQSVSYVQAAAAAGGRAWLQQLRGDHFTLIDPASPDWAAAVVALPQLLSA